MANSVPTLTGLTTPVIFLENTVNGAAQIIDADVTFTDPDNNFAGATLTVTGLLAQDTVAIRNQGTGTGEIGASGSDVTFGGIVIGSFAGGAGSTLTVTFNAAATAAGIEALIENLTYANLSDTPIASRSLELKVTDAAGFAAIAPIAFAEQTGAANPFNGVDVGILSTPSFGDLDGDGDLDALVGNQNGLLRYFENTGSVIAPAFTERTGAANPLNGFDVGFYSTPSFADLDDDGDLDAVVGEEDGTLHYFENTGTAIAPAFTERTGADNPFNGVDVGDYSAPSFADLDGDGDLDAVVAEAGPGGTPHYFENTGSATAPAFTERTGIANPFNGVDAGRAPAPSFADLDGDGDLDAVVGEFNGILHYFENTGSATAPVFTARTGTANPFNGVDVGLYSTPSFADLDGDGDLDAVVGEAFGTLHYFANTTPHQPAADFAEQTGAANPFNGVDVGGDSTPIFADLDGDGDLDAIVGTDVGPLHYFENTGSAIAPAFTERTGAANPFNGVDVGDFSKPSFADLDGDGDLDAVIWTNVGNFHYFENTGSAIAPAFTERTGAANPLNGVPGDYSTPKFADLDGDGDLDVVVGDFNGLLRYFENTGSAIAPAFTERTGAANPFNGIDVGSDGAPSFADLDGDGDLDVVVGDFNGLLHYFENTGSAIAPAFTERTGAANPFNGVAVAGVSKPSFADLDGDGDLDAVVGDDHGTLHYFRNTGAGFALVVDVTAENDAPVAGNDAAAGDEDTAITTGNVLANDTDVDSTLTAASISGFSQGAHGAVVHNGDGTFTYTPNADFNGTDSFNYTLNDGAGGSDTATVTLTINPVNDPPMLDLDANNSTAMGVNYAAFYIPQSMAVPITDADDTIVDSDNATLASATITLTNHQTNDLLSVNGALPGNITASVYDPATGVLTLTSAGATATLAQWQTALHQIEFSNTSADPNTTARDITIVVNDGAVDSNTTHATISLGLNALLAHLMNNPPPSTPSDDPGHSLEDLLPPPPIDLNVMLADAAASPPESTPTPWENPSFPFESTSVSGFDLF